VFTSIKDDLINPKNSINCLHNTLASVQMRIKTGQHKGAPTADISLLEILWRLTLPMISIYLVVGWHLLVRKPLVKLFAKMSKASEMVICINHFFAVWIGNCHSTDGWEDLRQSRPYSWFWGNGHDMLKIVCDSLAWCMALSPKRVQAILSYSAWNIVSAWLMM